MFGSLEPEEQVSYLQEALPKKPCEEVLGDGTTHNEEKIRELISEGKNVLVSQMQHGLDQWDYLIKNKEYFAESFKSEHSYRELAYYLSALENSGLETFPYRFNFDQGSGLAELVKQDDSSIEQISDYLITNGDTSVEKAFSEVGSDIWSNLGQEPTPRVAYFEDKNHLYIEFWLKTDTDNQFHERKGEYIEFPVLRKVIGRVHLDDGFVELRGRNERKKDREGGIIAVKNFLNDEVNFHGDSEIATDGGQDINITDETIRHFYTLPELQRVSHANKDGTAKSTWTAEEVRRDSRFPDDRPNNFNNFVFELDTAGRVSFQLSAEDDSFRIFQHKIMPGDHRSVTEYIWRNINNAPN